MILLLDALETENSTNDWLVEQAFVVFQQLEANGVHRLAELAVQRISEGLVKLRQVRMDAKQQLAMSRRASEQSYAQQQPQLTIDTASMDWSSSDTVMGNTGIFLLEDHGLQSYQPNINTFRPLSWTMAGMHSNQQSASSTPNTVLSPMVPVSQVTAAPFPIMTSPPFMGSTAGALPVTNSPYAVGLQPRLTGMQQQQHPGRRLPPYHGLPSVSEAYMYETHLQQPPPQQQQNAFTAVNAGQMGYLGPAYVQGQGQRQRSRHSHGSNSGQHRSERTPRSQQRRR